MTSRTACHHFLASDLVFRLKVQTFFGRQIAALPLHIKDFGFGPDEFFRLTVARETPFHLERVFLVDRRHIVDLSVARRTADALCYVDAVIEIREFGKVVDAFPLDRLVIAIAGADGFEIRAVGPYLTVAIHARLRRRHSC